MSTPNHTPTPSNSHPPIVFASAKQSAHENTIPSPKKSAHPSASATSNNNNYSAAAATIKTANNIHTYHLQIQTAKHNSSAQQTTAAAATTTVTTAAPSTYMSPQSQTIAATPASATTVPQTTTTTTTATTTTTSFTHLIAAPPLLGSLGSFNNRQQQNSSQGVLKYLRTGTSTQESTRPLSNDSRNVEVVPNAISTDIRKSTDQFSRTVLPTSLQSSLFKQQPQQKQAPYQSQQPSYLTSSLKSPIDNSIKASTLPNKKFAISSSTSDFQEHTSSSNNNTNNNNAYPINFDEIGIEPDSSSTPTSSVFSPHNHQTFANLLADKQGRSKHLDKVISSSSTTSNRKDLHTVKPSHNIHQLINPPHSSKATALESSTKLVSPFSVDTALSLRSSQEQAPWSNNQQSQAASNTKNLTLSSSAIHFPTHHPNHFSKTTTASELISNLTTSNKNNGISDLSSRLATTIGGTTASAANTTSTGRQGNPPSLSLDTFAKDRHQNQLVQTDSLAVQMQKVISQAALNKQQQYQQQHSQQQQQTYASIQSKKPNNTQDPKSTTSKHKKQQQQVPVSTASASHKQNQQSSLARSRVAMNGQMLTQPSTNNHAELSAAAAGSRNKLDSRESHLSRPINNSGSTNLAIRSSNSLPRNNYDHMTSTSSTTTSSYSRNLLRSSMNSSANLQGGNKTAITTATSVSRTAAVNAENDYPREQIAVHDLLRSKIANNNTNNNHQASLQVPSASTIGNNTNGGGGVLSLSESSSFTTSSNSHSQKPTTIMSSLQSQLQQLHSATKDHASNQKQQIYFMQEKKSTEQTKKSKRSSDNCTPHSLSTGNCASMSQQLHHQSQQLQPSLNSQQNSIGVFATTSTSSIANSNHHQSPAGYMHSTTTDSSSLQQLRHQTQSFNFGTTNSNTRFIGKNQKTIANDDNSEATDDYKAEPKFTLSLSQHAQQQRTVSSANDLNSQQAQQSQPSRIESLNNIAVYEPRNSFQPFHTSHSFVNSESTPANQSHSQSRQPSQSSSSAKQQQQELSSQQSHGTLSDIAGLLRQSLLQFQTDRIQQQHSKLDQLAHQQAGMIRGLDASNLNNKTASINSSSISQSKLYQPQSEQRNTPFSDNDSMIDSQPKQNPSIIVTPSSTQNKLNHPSIFSQVQLIPDFKLYNNPNEVFNNKFHDSGPLSERKVHVPLISSQPESRSSRDSPAQFNTRQMSNNATGGVCIPSRMAQSIRQSTSSLQSSIVHTTTAAAAATAARPVCSTENISHIDNSVYSFENRMQQFAKGLQQSSQKDLYQQVLSQQQSKVSSSRHIEHNNAIPELHPAQLTLIKSHISQILSTYKTAREKDQAKLIEQSMLIDSLKERIDNFKSQEYSQKLRLNEKDILISLLQDRILNLEMHLANPPNQQEQAPPALISTTHQPDQQQIECEEPSEEELVEQVQPNLSFDSLKRKYQVVQKKKKCKPKQNKKLVSPPPKGHFSKQKPLPKSTSNVPHAEEPMNSEAAKHNPLNDSFKLLQRMSSKKPIALFQAPTAATTPLPFSSTYRVDDYDQQEDEQDDNMPCFASPLQACFGSVEQVPCIHNESFQSNGSGTFGGVKQHEDVGVSACVNSKDQFNCSFEFTSGNRNNHNIPLDESFGNQPFQHDIEGRSVEQCYDQSNQENGAVNVSFEVLNAEQGETTPTNFVNQSFG